MQQQEEQQLARGSDSALYDRHGAIILAYARSRTASWQDAEDLTLEVFVKALEHDNLTWLSPGQQLAWLWRVAHHKLADSYRRPIQPPTVPLEHVVEQACRDEALSPEQLVLRREELAWLHQAVRKLAPQERQVLHLRFGEGLRFAEIAILMHKREAGVRKICSRSLARLRVSYEQQQKGVPS